MRDTLKIIILLISILISGRANAGLADRVKDLANPLEQDSAQIKAARNNANFCASCHHDDLSWFAKRK